MVPCLIISATIFPSAVPDFMCARNKSPALKCTMPNSSTNFAHCQYAKHGVKFICLLRSATWQFIYECWKCVHRAISAVSLSGTWYWSLVISTLAGSKDLMLSPGSLCQSLALPIQTQSCDQSSWGIFWYQALPHQAAQKIKLTISEFKAHGMLGLSACALLTSCSQEISVFCCSDRILHHIHDQVGYWAQRFTRFLHEFSSSGKHVLPFSMWSAERLQHWVHDEFAIYVWRGVGALQGFV